MSGADLFEDGFPHGTVEGFDRGCRGGSCPANVEHGLSCQKANMASAGDYRYKRLVLEGKSPAEIAAVLFDRTTPEPAKTPAPAKESPVTMKPAPKLAPPKKTPAPVPVAAQPLVERSHDRTSDELDDAGRREEMGHPTIDEITAGLTTAQTAATKREIRAWAVTHGFPAAANTRRQIPGAALAAWRDAALETWADGLARERAGFSFTEQLDEARDRVGEVGESAEGMPADLQGATTGPPPGVRITTSGEFAARWNSLAPEARQTWVEGMAMQADDARECFAGDHERRIELLSGAVDMATNDLRELADERDRARGTAARLWDELERTQAALELALRSWGRERARTAGLERQLSELLDYATGLIGWWAARCSRYFGELQAAQRDARDARPAAARPWWKRAAR